ncbi:Crp/Fnr family transcriptional regulator [Aquimarina megaterium]|uniref:Crp/Fnr family transcriptional regulator n=1 Tax=Aquimarina megaterium TaxID=1443666 RepID=UPI000471C453|nr:Crp/Fnr family transcriptional regulator [Aquimarina megaterium]
MNSLVAFIQHIIPATEAEAIDIARSFEYKELKKGDFIVQEGKISNDYYFFEKGLLRTYLYDIEGNEVTTDFYTSNSIVFEVTSFFQRVPSQVNIQAVTDCRGYRFSYQQLNSLFHNKPAFRDFGRAILVKEFIASKKRTISMINQTAEQRYKALLQSNSEIIMNAPLKHIASYLGITDSTLSRIRKDVVKK